MLETEIVKELHLVVAAGADSDSDSDSDSNSDADADANANANASAGASFCAASGLVRVADHLFVIADDQNHLARFNLNGQAPGQAIPLFEGRLPRKHKARKAAKPDCEALLLLPAFADYRCGALMAVGSGSLPSRQRAALSALDAHGEVIGPALTLDLKPLFDTLRMHFPQLNIEGALIQDDLFCLLQRGNGPGAINARIDWYWADIEAWLCGNRAAPNPRRVQSFELGAISGVPLSFTDGAALPDGEWLFSAAAEDTQDSVADGACAGSAVGIVDAAGKVCTMTVLALNCKVEGVVAAVHGDSIKLLMVTDADDRHLPAKLLAASLRR